MPRHNTVLPAAGRAVTAWQGRSRNGGGRMKGEELRAMQAPCKVETGRALVEAGLHPATGGDGISACSGDMLLEALVACAGVTVKAVATALEIELRGGTVSAGGDPAFRGTLGV